MLMTAEGLRRGQLVCSVAGRDRQKYYLIWNMDGEKFIEVVDGVKHPVIRPKKKSLKHVKISMVVATEIEEAILRGEIVRDSQIAAAIDQRQNELEEGDRFHG